MTIITPIIKEAQKARFSTLDLETAMIRLPNSRVAENHGIEYLQKQLNGLPFNIGIKCDRKLKKCSVALVKPTAMEVKQYGDMDFVIQLSAIQVSYDSLVEAKVLAEKLIKVYDDKNRVLKFPAGNQAKGLSAKDFEIWKAYKISRYDGFDNKIANGCNHVCTGCSYSFTAINMPNPDQPYSCPKCSNPMVSQRVNYNYRSDNTKGEKSRHWGTHSSSELLAFIDVFSPSFKMLSKEARKEALSLQGIEADQVAELGADQVANFKIEKKADRFDAMTYNELKKLIKKLNIEVPNKRKDTLINALRSN